MENKEKINSINYLKLICSFLVVAIHTYPFLDVNSFLHYSFSEVLVRIAVPFFFVSSGYFFMKNNCNIKKYLNRLLITYISWSFVYLILQIYTLIRKNINISIILKSFIIEFFLYGSYYHMWYIVAIIFCVMITFVFNKRNRMNLLYSITLGLYVIGVIGSAYYQISMKLPLLYSLYEFRFYTQIRRYLLMGLSFFVLGCKISKINKIPRNIEIMCIITVLLFIFEILFVNLFQIQRDIILTFLLYPLVIEVFIICLKYPMKNSRINLGKISSFVYFVHPLIIYFLNQIISGQTLLFVVTCLISLFIALFFYMINNSTINKLFF